MSFKLVLAALALSLAPALVSAACSHERQAMSCTAGTVYDAASGTCIPEVTS